MNSSPKAFSDFIQTNVLAGFLVYFGDYLLSRDAWAVHHWLGPCIVVLSLFLYVWNWYGGWVQLIAYPRLRVLARGWKRWVFGAVYVVCGLMFSDAFIHWHHEVGPKISQAIAKDLK